MKKDIFQEIDESLLKQIREYYRIGLTYTSNALEAAALIHKEFVLIHPFIDGNGRIARLLMNLHLLQEGYNIAVIPPVLRREYIDALEKSHTDDRDFIHFIARMARETQKDYLRLFLK